MYLIGARSITRPSSQFPNPALCPPPRIETRRLLSRPKFTERMTYAHPRIARLTAAFVDHPVVDLARFIIIGVARLNQPSAKVCFKIGNRILVEHIRKQ